MVCIVSAIPGSLREKSAYCLNIFLVNPTYGSLLSCITIAPKEPSSIRASLLSTCTNTGKEPLLWRACCLNRGERQRLQRCAEVCKTHLAFRGFFPPVGFAFWWKEDFSFQETKEKEKRDIKKAENSEVNEKKLIWISTYNFYVSKRKGSIFPPCVQQRKQRVMGSYCRKNIRYYRNKFYGHKDGETQGQAAEKAGVTPTLDGFKNILNLHQAWLSNSGWSWRLSSLPLQLLSHSSGSRSVTSVSVLSGITALPQCLEVQNEHD